MLSRFFTALLGLSIVAIPSWNSKAEPPGTGPKIKLRLMAEGFVSPSVAVPMDAKSGQMLVADQSGLVRVMRRDGTLGENLFLDLTSRMFKLNPAFDERGLLGLALHPKF